MDETRYINVVTVKNVYTHEVRDLCLRCYESPGVSGDLPLHGAHQGLECAECGVRARDVVYVIELAPIYGEGSRPRYWRDLGQDGFSSGSRVGTRVDDLREASRYASRSAAERACRAMDALAKRILEKREPITLE